jgi:cytochrome c peroxidase
MTASRHLLLLCCCLTCLACTTVTAAPAPPDPKQELGRAIFFDTQLSEPAGQSCASCHQPQHAFADPGKAVSLGANPGLAGNRNTPSISYARYIPSPSWNAEDETWIGGFFLDGRAHSLQEQARGPMLNPLEMGNRDARMLARKIRQRPYAAQLAAIYGKQVMDSDQEAIAAVSDAIAQYEQSGDFAPFTSKYDAYLQGKLTLSAQEKRGLQLFEDEKKGNCAACHPSTKAEDGSLPMFTDFSYDNIGVPANPHIKPQHDMGLGNTAYASAHDERGKFRVQTLRNINRTAPYMHNGVFDNLHDAIAFYNTRDTEKKWGTPDVEHNVNQEELGDLKLSDADIDDIAAFLKTLDDGYQIKNHSTQE